MLASSRLYVSLFTIFTSRGLRKSTGVEGPSELFNESELATVVVRLIKIFILIEYPDFVVSQITVLIGDIQGRILGREELHGLG